ncbi:MAG TPA: ABC transporter permease [Acidimicrobiales bacterium]|nr:ABC transporter permease [Acidimicrobiales bacterium]
MTSIVDMPLHGAPAAKSHRVAETLSRVRELTIVAAVLIVFAVTTAKNHSFAHSHSIQEILTGTAIIALLGVGETLVIVTRNVDLSVGSTLGLSAFEIGDLFTHHPHFPVPLAFLVGIAIGTATGAVIGLVTVVARVPSLVVTLAALYIIRGYVNVIGTGVQIEPSSIPSSFQKVGYESVLGIPWLFVIVVVVVAVVAWVMRSFRPSRDLYAIGSNPEAAALAGVPISKRVFTAFVVSGALAGLAGALFLAEYATVDATGGSGYELTVVAAVVVGGVAIFGGSGTVVGAALGALLLQTINQALQAVNVAQFWDEGVAGALLLAAIAFDRLVAVRAASALRAKEGATYVA